jgi:3-deoxy-D-manno-octulosonic-acid transferase
VAQTSAVGDALVALGAEPGRVTVGGNMKASAPPPPDDSAERERLAGVLNGAKIWAAVSTHPGEEEAALAAHEKVRERHPGARLILVPRHPVRGDAIAGLVAARGLGVARRSKGEDPTEPVYLADTLGETGLWFRLAPLAFLGGSLVTVGGHNPWEAAQCGAALLIGPLRETVRADVAELEAAGAALTVADAGGLGEQAAALLGDPGRLGAMREAGPTLAAAQVGWADALARELLGMLT